MNTIDNPYASPRSLTVDDIPISPRLTTRRMIALTGIGLIAGAALGSITNSVNGALSPQYFRDVMDWYGSNIWISAVGQGALEGAIYGLAYVLIFIALIAGISRRRCGFRTAIRYVGLTFSLAFTFWLLGGAIAVAFARLFPNLCDPVFFGDQYTWPALVCYAWVRGSIWGAVFGGLFSVLITNVIYTLRHRRANLLEFKSLKLRATNHPPQSGSVEDRYPP